MRAVKTFETFEDAVGEVPEAGEWYKRMAKEVGAASRTARLGDDSCSVDRRCAEEEGEAARCERRGARRDDDERYRDRGSEPGAGASREVHQISIYPRNEAFLHISSARSMARRSNVDARDGVASARDGVASAAELVELVRDATRRVLPMVDIETVTEREVVGMVEHRMGVLVAGDETLRSAVQGEIDAFLLRRDDPATEAERAPPNPAAKRKRRKSPPLAGFVVPDDASDGDEVGRGGGGGSGGGGGGRRGAAAAGRQDEDAAARGDTRVPRRRGRSGLPRPCPGPAAPAAAAPGASAAPAARPRSRTECDVARRRRPNGEGPRARVLKANKSDVNERCTSRQSAGRAAKADAGGGAPTWTATGGVRGAPGRRRGTGRSRACSSRTSRPRAARQARPRRVRLDRRRVRLDRGGGRRRPRSDLRVISISAVRRGEYTWFEW